MAQVIVIGGGLAGLSAAHTVLENGGNVVVLDKNSFLGGNSTKATSGINGALTRTQIQKGIQDSPEAFYNDTARSARDRLRPDLVKVLTHQSGPAVEWLQDAFKLDLSLVSRLGGHSFPRTHRGKERFPGMTITYALMEKLEEITKATPNRARIITKARATKLLTCPNSGKVTGVEYEKDGQTFQEHGPVIVATGGYGSDFTEGSLLNKYRPDLAHLPTTNGDHCSGDGIKMAVAIGANTADMEYVQVHPTGLVDLKEPDAKLKFLAAEALRGVGGLLLDNEGNRFCDELGHRDYVTGEMWKRKKAPYYLVLNGAASKEIEWHCKHYVGRNLMKKYNSGAAFAADIGVPVKKLEETFKAYNEVAETKKDPFGKKYFHNLPFNVSDEFHVSIVTPVIHYCMGGLEVNAEARVVGTKGPIAGLYATGEVCGGVHGANRLGGNSLLDCVVYGRVSGATATRDLLQNLSQEKAEGSLGTAARRLNNIVNHVTGNQVVATIAQQGVQTQVSVDPVQKKVSLEFFWDQSGAPTSGPAPAAAPAQAAPAAAPAKAAAPAAAPAKKEYTAEEVAKHNTEKDCWVIVNGQVLNVTEFLPEHPGGKKAILIYAGRDATAEFNMLHKPDVVDKYAPTAIIGTVKGGAAPAHK